jgi:hypothetical protein
MTNIWLRLEGANISQTSSSIRKSEKRKDCLGLWGDDGGKLLKASNPQHPVW